MSTDSVLSWYLHDTVITYIECVLGKNWKPLDSPRTREEFNAFLATSPEADVSLVRPDELVRRFSFRNNSLIRIGSNAIKFRASDVIDEISTDEDKQTGKPSNKRCPSQRRPINIRFKSSVCPTIIFSISAVTCRITKLSFSTRWVISLMSIQTMSPASY